MTTTIRADDGDSICVEACAILPQHAMVMIQVDNVLHEDGSDWITISTAKARDLARALTPAATTAEIISATERTGVTKLTPEGKRLVS